MPISMKKKKNKLALGFVTSEEFLSRAALLDPNTNRARLYGSENTRYTNQNGGALFVACHETHAAVKKFFDSLERFGVEIQCEHNAVQPNYSATIRLFIPKCNMLKVMAEMVRVHPDEMHIVSDTVADFWWD